MPDDLSTQLPLTEPHDLAFWREEVRRAEHVRKAYEPWWEANIKAYAPQPSDDPTSYGERINTNRDFTLVERKKADLFFQRPDVSCTPSPLFEGREALLETHGDIINELLGLDGVNAVRLAHECIFDLLATSGCGWSEIGYEAVFAPAPAPVAVPGSVLGLSQPQPVQVPLFERVFWSHVSPKRTLIPADFKSTNYDQAPWLGYRFEVPLATAKQQWNLPEDFKGGEKIGTQAFDFGVSDQKPTDKIVGTKLWYKSALYREDVTHPQHLTLLVFVDGLDEPVEHKGLPYQTLDPQGKLTPDSMIGFPLQAMVTRVMTDSAYVPSDCTISRPIVNELNKFREQMVLMRDANILRWMYNTDTLPKEAVNKMVRSPIGGMIGVPGEAFVGEGAIKELPHSTFPRENFTFNDYLDNDLARTHAMDAEQQGAGSNGGKTATEISTVQANVNARLDSERGIILNDWYVRGVTKFSTLVQRYLPLEQAARIVGPEKAQEWDGWRKTVPASLAFQAQPDSALRTDLAYERKQIMDLYSFLANEPQVNRLELVKSLLRKFHLPVDKIVNEQPPEKQPEAAKMSLSIASASLNPMLPEYANLYQILTQQGIKNLTPSNPMAILNQPPAPLETEHGGKQPQAESLDKHQAEQTGAMQGSGQPAPMGAGGMVQ